MNPSPLASNSSPESEPPHPIGLRSETVRIDKLFSLGDSQMIALKLSLDGKPLITAGVEDWSLVRAEVLAMRHEPDSAVKDGYIELSSGGLTLPDNNDVRYHFRWPRLGLPVGSVVTIEVVETTTSTPPKKRYRSDAKVQESPFTEDEIRQMRYQDYLALKAEFEDSTNG